MKKHLLILLGMLISVSVYSQTTCATAKTFLTDTLNPQLEEHTTAVCWYKFVAQNTKLDITFLEYYSNTSNKMLSAKLWSGACSSLTNLTNDTISGTTDSTLFLSTTSLTIGNTYYVQINKTSTSSDTLKFFALFDFKLAPVISCSSSCSSPPSCNLICNPSFEDYSALPVSSVFSEQIHLACPWTSGNLATPDYYNSGCAGGTFDVPINWIGTEPANTGNGYAGIVTSYNPPTNYREYIQAPLRSTLVAGVTYTLTFWISLGDNSDFDAQLNAVVCPHSAIPAPTSTSSITISPGPAVHTLVGGYIFNKYGWSFLTTTFVATGTEDYIIFGNFNSTTLMTPAIPAGSYYGSYVYIDDVSLTPVNTLTVSATPAAICSGNTTTLSSNFPSTALDWTPSGSVVTTPSTSTATIPLTTNTTFSGTITYCTGCQYTASTTVTVHPTPVMNSVSNVQACNGSIVAASSYLVTPTGSTLNWTNSNTAIGLGASGSGNTPSFTATNTGSAPISGTITVTPTYGGCTGTPVAYTITVYPTPVATATPSSQSICNGSTTGIALSTVGPVSGTTFAWTVVQTGVTGASAGSGSSIAQTLTLTGSGSGTAVYTITPTANGCTGTPITVTVTVNPVPSVTASATPPLITGGLSSSLSTTVSGGSGFTYSWSPSGTLDNATIANPTATPLSTTTYTVTVTNSAGCFSTATVTVTVTYPECLITIPPGNNIGTTTASAFFGVGGNPTATSNYTLTGTLTINQNTTFNADNLKMLSPHARININSGSTLTLINQTHLYSCDSMWDGIYVASSASIVTGSSAFIEDATTGINIPQGATGTIQNTIFSKNLTAITLTANTSASSPVVITGCVFTSRYIPTGATTSGNPTVTAVWTNVTGGSPYPSAVMRPPNAVSKGVWGITATDVKTLTIGSTGSPYVYNGFDDIKVGCNIVNTAAATVTNTTINFNNFQYLNDPSACFGCPYIYHGYGVLATGPSGVTGASTITVGSTTATGSPINTFNSIYRAVEIDDYKTVTVANNSIDNINTETVGIPYGYGDIGVLVKPAASSTVIVSDQSLINNCVTGIWINHSTPAINSAALTIDNNASITANGSGYCTDGIIVTDVSGGSSTKPTTWEIKGNTITESANCIFLQNVVKPAGTTIALDVMSNSCSVRYTSAAVNTNGIAANACKGVAITLNHTKYHNILHPWSYESGGNILSYGIYLQSSTNMLLKCNQIDDAARSMVFQGTCSSPLTTNTSPAIGITQNTMHNAFDGFVLQSTGVIGSQGSGSVASNNVWDLTSTFTRSQTYTELTGANTSSKLYMNTTIVPYPTINSTSASDAYSTGSGGLNNSTGTPSACGSVPALMVHPHDTRDVLIDSTYANDLINMVEDTATLPVYSNAAHWQRKNYVYNEIKNNSVLTAYTVLDSFYTANAATAFGKFSDVTDAITNGDYTSANSTNNSLLPANTIEQNQQTVNNLLLLPLLDSNYVYTSNDSITLNSIAYQCPVAGGNAVYQARNLLMTIANNVITFIDSCNAVPKNSPPSLKSFHAESNESFRLYPNPNNGNMQLDYTLVANEKGVIMIYDITGKLITNYQLDNSANRLTINNEQLKNGIYFYRIAVNNKIVKSDKLIIIK